MRGMPCTQGVSECGVFSSEFFFCVVGIGEPHHLCSGLGFRENCLVVSGFRGSSPVPGAYISQSIAHPKSMSLMPLEVKVEGIYTHSPPSSPVQSRSITCETVGAAPVRSGQEAKPRVFYSWFVIAV